MKKKILTNLIICMLLISSIFLITGCGKEKEETPIQLYCNVNELPVTVETTDASIQGINGVTNGDYAAKRHWQYKINGELCKTPENEKILKDGDTLEWVFKK